MGRELLHVDKQTGMKKQPVDFRNFAKAPKRNDIYDIKTFLFELYFNSVAVTVLTPPV
jgi:hypothetical protein